MKVKCEYCGGYIDETEERCHFCGAVNSQYHRSAKTTPQTIAELKDWYRARNLPSEEITRFFIGRNIREPKAFGIYEENGNFIVYKNKSDGSRAIRYQGTDEAYAVNEMYLKLKEEILNQKNLNARKRSRNSSLNRKKGYSKKKNSSLLSVIVYAGILITILFTFIVPMVSFVNYTITESNSVHSFDYLYTSNHDLYYCASTYSNEWYQYDFISDEWYLYSGEFQNSIPIGVTDEVKEVRHDSVYDVLAYVNADYNRDYSSEDLNIYNSRNYIDNGHHYTPEQRYYLYNNEYYYYLDDRYGSEYGTRDNSGWYKYNSDADSWGYYCDFEDKSKLGEDLYYHDDDYVVYDFKSAYDYAPNETWNATQFEDTDWYIESEKSSALHQEEVDRWHEDNDSSSSSWDWSSDSDWDWDSGSDWDSGGTDWDSDW